MLSSSTLEYFNTLNNKQKSIYVAKRILLIGLPVPTFQRTGTKFIYSLIDPITDDVKYIGQTNNPQRRFAAHLHEKRGLNEKLEWITSLKARKLKPEMKVLDETRDFYKIREKERRWIFHFVQQGAYLLQKEYFINPYLMNEVFLTKNVNFLKTGLTGKFWQRLFLAYVLDSQLVQEVNSKFTDKERLSISFYEEVRKEYERRPIELIALKS